MPYSNDETPEQTRKMEDCVRQVMADGKSKSEAIAICQTSVKGKRRGNKTSRRRSGNSS